MRKHEWKWSLFLLFLALETNAFSTVRALSVPDSVIPSNSKPTPILNAVSFEDDVATTEEPSVTELQEKSFIKRNALQKFTSYCQNFIASHRTSLFIAGMAGGTGFTDIIYIHKFDCFVNMVTGNTIRATWALAEGNWYQVAFLWGIVLTYTVGNAWHRWWDLHIIDTTPLKESETENTRMLKRTAPWVLASFCLADVFSSTHFHALWLSFGFGILNGATSQATGGTILYAVTGHWMKLGRIFSECTRGKTPYSALKVHLQSLGSFCGGLFISVFAYSKVTQYSQILPLQTTIGAYFAAIMVWYGRSIERENKKTALER